MSGRLGGVARWLTLARVKLFDRVRRGDVDGVAALLDQWPELVSAKNRDGLTPLHVACREAGLLVATLLLERGADPHEAGVGAWTPLHYAVWSQSGPLVKLLLEHGADVTPRKWWGVVWSPLHVAASRGGAGVARLLLDHGAEVNAVEPWVGATPLHIAAARGYAVMAELFLDRGADPRVVDKQGYTPLHLAVELQNDELVTQLLSRGAEVDVFTAAALGRVDVLEALLEDRPERVHEAILGATPLHWAVWTNQGPAALTLLAGGARVNAWAPGAGTPLRLAVRCGHDRMVGLLRRSGGKVWRWLPWSIDVGLASSLLSMLAERLAAPEARTHGGVFAGSAPARERSREAGGDERGLTARTEYRPRSR